LFPHQADEQHTKAVPQHGPQNIAYQIVHIGLSTTKDILKQLNHKRCADPGGQHPKPPSEMLYRKRKQYAQWKEHGDVQQRV
jgi:transposase